MKRARIIILLIIAFTVLGIIYSYPLIFSFNTAIPYTHIPPENLEKILFIQGDHLQLYYSLWLFMDYFASKGQRFFEEPYQFTINPVRDEVSNGVKGSPRPYTLRELPLPIFFLIFSFFGNITAYNYLIILSFILCGISMFLLSKKYLHSTFVSFITSCIFTIMPFRLAHLFGGHPSGFMVFWIPLIIYLYELLWEKGKTLYGWIAGICIFLMAIGEPHLTYFSALFTIAFWTYKIMFYNKQPTLNKIARLSIPVLLSWMLVILYMLYMKQGVLSSSIAGHGRGFAEIRLFAPTINKIFQRLNRENEKYIYLGIVTSVLLIYSIIRKAIMDRKDRFPFLFYLATFLVTLLLSLGPNMEYFPIYKICYRIIPFFRFPRSPARIIVFTSISLSLLAGYGLSALLQNKRKLTKSIIATLILLSICLDFKPYKKIGLCYLPTENMVYQYIKDTHPEKPILEIPIWPGESSWSSIYLYYTTLYRIPIINGYSAFVTKEYVDKIFWPLVSINMGILTKEQYELIKQLGVRYILLHAEAYPEKVSPFPFKIALENLKKNPYVKFVTMDHPVYLFELQDETKEIIYNPYTIPSKTGLFYECEHLSHRGGLVSDNTASSGKALFIEESLTNPIEFVFGPWKLFPPGRYKVIYRLKGEAKNPFTPLEVVPQSGTLLLTGLTTIEITTDQGKKRMTHKDIEITDIYNDYELHLALDITTRLEFRVIYYGDYKLWADYVYILCEEEDDPRWSFESEEMPHMGRDVIDKDASGNYAVYLQPGLDPKTDVLSGPYRRYPPSRYKIGFRLKLPEISNNTVCTLKVLWANSNIVIAEKELKGSDFSSENTYEYHYLTAELARPSVLEFKIWFSGKTPLYIDAVKVEPI